MNNLLELAKSLNIIDVEAPGVEPKDSQRKKRRKRPEQKSNPDPYKYLICLDFEATCWEKADQAKWKVQELIEFPAVLVDMETGNVISEFREYLKPSEFPTLTDFCVQLTHITQDTVNAGISIGHCLLQFDVWLKWKCKEYGLILPKTHPDNPAGNVALVSWTDWDLICLAKECARKKIRKASYLNQWIDARKIFMKHFKHKPKSFDAALNHAGLKFEGQPHSGLDDARNLARLVYKMRKNGARFHVTKDNFPYQNINKPF